MNNIVVNFYPAEVTLLRLNEIVKKREIIQADPTLDAMEKTEKVNELN